VSAIIILLLILHFRRRNSNSRVSEWLKFQKRKPSMDAYIGPPETPPNPSEMPVPQFAYMADEDGGKKRETMRFQEMPA
jgi:hypothetical protein